MNKNNTFLSIIVPVYNVSQYLDVAVNSILNQNCKDYEIILVEDCSTDGSRQLCVDIAKKHLNVRLICHEKNLGLGGARNTGLKEAIGSYIVFMDSDDLMHPKYLQNLQNLLIDAVESTDLLISMPEVFNDETKEIYEWMDLGQFKQLPLDINISPNDYNSVYFLEVCAWRKVYRRDFLIDNNLYFPEYLKYEDFAHHFKVLALSSNVILSDITSVYYRVGRPNQITGSKNASRMDICPIFESGYKFLVDRNNTPDKVIVCYHRWAIIFTIWNLSLIDASHRKEFLDRLNQYWASISYKSLHLNLLTPYEQSCIKIFRSKFWIHTVFVNEYSNKIWSKLAKKFILIRILIGGFYE